MSTDYDEWYDTEVEAHNTKCSSCGAQYEVVRIGKVQPSCLCEAYRVQGFNLEETQRQLDIANRKREEYGFLLMLEEMVRKYTITNDHFERGAIRDEMFDCLKHINAARKKQQ